MKSCQTHSWYPMLNLFFCTNCPIQSPWWSKGLIFTSLKWKIRFFLCWHRWDYLKWPHFSSPPPDTYRLGMTCRKCGQDELDYYVSPGEEMR